MTMFDFLSKKGMDAQLITHGETIVYTVKSTGIGYSIEAVVQRNKALEKNKEDDGWWIYRESEISISTDSSDGIANPQEDDWVTFDSLDWDVMAVLDKIGNRVQLNVVNATKLEDSDPEFRGEM